MKIKLRYDEILPNICLVFVALHILSYRYPMWEEIIPIISIGYIVIGMISLIYYCNPSNYYCYLVIGISFISGLLNYYLIGNITSKILVQDCFLWAMSFPLVMRNYSEKVIKVFMAFILIVFSWDMVHGISPDLIMNHVSRNYISVVILLTLILYYSQVEFKNKEVSLVPAVVGFALAVYGQSRSGILSIGFLVLGILYYKYRKIVKIKLIAYTGVLIAVIAIVSNVRRILVFFTNAFTQFAQNGLVSIRTVMWANYLDLIKGNVFYLFFGASLNANNYQFYNSRFGINLHNTFMSLHEYYGLIMFVTVIWTFIKTFLLFKQERKYIQMILLIALMMRSFSDNMLFSTHNVPLFGFFIFYALQKEKYRKTKFRFISKFKILRVSQNEDR